MVDEVEHGEGQAPLPDEAQPTAQQAMRRSEHQGRVLEIDEFGHPRRLMIS